MYILLEKMLSKPVDKDTFEQCKSLLNNGAHLSDAEVNLDAAACFLFTTLLSVRNTGHTFSEKALSTYRKNMDAIALLNERMKDTEIYGRYALELIEEYMKSEDSIFIIDPPYIDTNVYKSSIKIDVKYDDEQKEFGYKEHKQLAKLLRRTHKEYGNDFIYFCRITAPHKFRSKPDKDKHDRHMEGRIDDLYWGYGYYYIDVLYDEEDNTTERIITSFYFSGAQPYGNGRGQN